jgi:MFS family permease
MLATYAPVGPAAAWLLIALRCVIAFSVGGYSGVPAYLMEGASPRRRGFFATTIFGGFTPYIAQMLIESTGWNLVPSAMIAVVALCVPPVLLTMPETAPGFPFANEG